MSRYSSSSSVFFLSFGMSSTAKRLFMFSQCAMRDICTSGIVTPGTDIMLTSEFSMNAWIPVLLPGPPSFPM